MHFSMTRISEQRTGFLLNVKLFYVYSGLFFLPYAFGLVPFWLLPLVAFWLCLFGPVVGHPKPL